MEMAVGQGIVAQRTTALGPKTHPDPLKHALTAKLPQTAVEPGRLFPQFQQDGSQSPPYPGRKLPVLTLAIGYPKVVG